MSKLLSWSRYFQWWKGESALVIMQSYCSVVLYQHMSAALKTLNIYFCFKWKMEIALSHSSNLPAHCIVVFIPSDLLLTSTWEHVEYGNTNHKVSLRGSAHFQFAFEAQEKKHSSVFKKTSCTLTHPKLTHHSEEVGTNEGVSARGCQ